MFGLFRKGEVNLNNRFEFERTLTSMIEILKDNGFGGQAAAVKNVLSSLIQDKKEEFVKRLNSVDMWGGAGAVWEVVGFRTKNEETQFWKLLIELTEEMKKARINNRRAFSTADIFRKEIKKVVEK